MPPKSKKRALPVADAKLELDSIPAKINRPKPANQKDSKKVRISLEAYDQEKILQNY